MMLSAGKFQISVAGCKVLKNVHENGVKWFSNVAYVFFLTNTDIWTCRVHTHTHTHISMQYTYISVQFIYL
jgi:hypothetical protein